MDTYEPTKSKRVKNSSELTARQIINLLKDSELKYKQAIEIENWLYPLKKWED